MKNKTVMWVVGIFLAVSVLQGWTQDTENKQSESQQQMTHWSLDVRHQVKPESFDKHIQMIKEMKSQFTEHHYSSPCMVFLGDEFDVMHIIPIESMAGLDQAHKEYMQLADAVGKEKWQKMEEEMGSTTEYSEICISAFRPDLSYLEKESDREFDPQKAGYALVEFYYVKPGMEMKGEEVARKIADLQKEKKSPITCKVRQIVLGSEVPCYLAIFIADNKESLHSKMMEREKLLGEEFQQLMAEGRSLLRRVDKKEFHHDPALSYFPPEFIERINADTSEPGKSVD